MNVFVITRTDRTSSSSSTASPSAGAKAEISSRRSVALLNALLAPGNESETDHPGVVALREILSRWFDPRQGGGILGLGRDGRWRFRASELGVATPDQIDALFALVGLEPKPIEPRGNCSVCRWAKNGHERDFFPCSPCTIPWRSNFEPVDGSPPDDVGLADRLVRHVTGAATAQDVEIDAGTKLMPWLNDAAKSGGRAAVVAAIDNLVAMQDWKDP